MKKDLWRLWSVELRWSYSWTTWTAWSLTHACSPWRTLWKPECCLTDVRYEPRISTAVTGYVICGRSTFGTIDARLRRGIYGVQSGPAYRHRWCSLTCRWQTLRSRLTNQTNRLLGMLHPMRWLLSGLQPTRWLAFIYPPHLG